MPLFSCLVPSISVIHRVYLQCERVHKASNLPSIALEIAMLLCYVISVSSQYSDQMFMLPIRCPFEISGTEFLGVR